MARRPRFRTGAAANVLQQVEYAKPDILRRMALRAQQLARVVDPDELVSESWLMEGVTGVRSRGADTTASLVGSAVVEDLSALAIRLTERAPILAAGAQGGAFTLEQAARKLGVGVRSVQRWRGLGLVCMRFQFGRARRVGCSASAIEWFEKRHPELLTKAKRVGPTRLERQKLFERARAIALGGPTLNAAAVALARKEKLTVPLARRIFEQLEMAGSIAPLKRRTSLSESKAGSAWQSWMRGVDLNAIARRAGQTRSAVLRTIAKQRLRRIRECAAPVAPLATFSRPDAEQTLLAPAEARQHLPVGAWSAQPLEFLAAFPPVAHSRKKTAIRDGLQLNALRFLLWQAQQGALALDRRTNRNARRRGAGRRASTDEVPVSIPIGMWNELDRLETALRWAARLRLALVQQSVGQALGRLQAIAGVPLGSLHGARIRQAIEIALGSACAVLDQILSAQPSDRTVHIGSLSADHAEKTSLKGWTPREEPAQGERVELPPGLQIRCAPWMSVAPLRDEWSLVPAMAGVGREVLSLRHGWNGEHPRTMLEAAKQLGIHGRRAAILSADMARRLERINAC